MPIASATIAPITVKDLKSPRQVLVDLQHPITKAFLDRLPKVPDSDLPLILRHLRNGPDNADTRSWIQLTEAEIAHRAREPHDLLDVLKAHFAARTKEG